MDRLLRLLDMGAALALARRKAARDRWPPERIRAFQSARFGALARHAARRTRLYAALYAGIDLSDPLDPSRLPETGKRLLMERFEEGVTDPRLTRARVLDHATQLSGDALLDGAYRVIATTGTSGLRGHFVYDRSAWRAVLADTLRWNAMIGLSPRLPRRPRIASIGADSPLHVTSRIALSCDAGLFRILRLPATEPVSTLAAALGRFQPDALLGYPSLLAQLALEQLDGRLAIRPRLISTHSETLTTEMRARIRSAWGLEAFDHYGLTEAPHVAAECPAHRGLHLFEDSVLVEPVDERGAAVPPGAEAARWLLTNLTNRVQPIIRYAVDDVVMLGEDSCACGRPGRLLVAIGGRREDALRLPAASGGDPAVVSPHAVALAIEAVAEIAEYAVAQEGARVIVAVVPRRGAAAEAARAAAAAALSAGLRAAGAAPEAVDVRLVDALPRSRDRIGKLRLVRGAAAASPVVS